MFSVVYPFTPRRCKSAMTSGRSAPSKLWARIRALWRCEAEVDGVGTIFDGGDQARPIASRRQQLGFRSHGFRSACNRFSGAARSASLVVSRVSIIGPLSMVALARTE